MFVLLTFGLMANGGVERVDVQLELEGGMAYLKETITFTEVDSLNQVRLKSLPLNGSELLLDSLVSGKQTLSVDIESLDPLLEMVLDTKDILNKTITLHYRVRTPDGSFYLPIFFTEFTASNSEADFFSMEMNWPPNKNYQVQFPKVPLMTNEEGDNIQTSLVLPALPSMIKMKRSDQNEVDQLDLWVDWGVAFVFFVIGVILWINRKKLSYG